MRYSLSDFRRAADRHMDGMELSRAARERLTQPRRARSLTLSAVGWTAAAACLALLLMSLLGLALNLSGVGRLLDDIGIGSILTGCTAFLAQPVSAVMIFSVGYHFSLEKGSRGPVFRLCGVHLGMFAVFCLIIQGVLLLIPGVEAMTRWAILLYCALPASYLAPGLGRSEEDFTVASGVCSVLTIACLAVFCCIAAVVS